MDPSHAPSLAPLLRNDSLQLTDGRRLAWAEFGAPDGRPVLYCHGTPGSRLEARLAGAAAERLGIRLIAADRPGYGDSTPLNERTPLAVGKDLRQLCDHLGLEKVYLLGVSGGGPFACAAAGVLGPTVIALGLVCPVGPLRGHSTGELPLFPWRGMSAWNRWPLPVRRAALAPLSALLRRLPQRFLRKLTRQLGESDRTTLADPAIADQLADSLRTALQAGSRGFLDDLTTFTSRWDMSLAAVRCPVLIWQGLDDQLVPPCLAKRLLSEIANCRLRLLPGEGHYSLPIRHAEALLGELIHHPAQAHQTCYTDS